MTSREFNQTIIMITHDDAIAQLADRKHDILIHILYRDQIIVLEDKTDMPTPKHRQLLL